MSPKLLLAFLLVLSELRAQPAFPHLKSKIEILLSKEDCDPIREFSQSYQDETFGSLPKAWPQYLIGADLAVADLKQDPALGTVNVGVLDRAFSFNAVDPSKISKATYEISRKSDGRPNYGTAVLNMIVDPSSVGTTYFARISMAVPIFWDTEYTRKDLGTLFESLGEPRLITATMEPGYIPDLYRKQLPKLSKKTFLVAPNDFWGNSDNDITDWLLNESVIVVNDVLPNGMLSALSPTGNHITVSAPAMFMAYSRVGSAGDRNEYDFAPIKTAGAAALVTGSVANLLSYLPPHDGQDLQVDELKTLLRKSSFLTQGVVNKAQNGAGVVNPYKLIRVGQRLQPKWPQSRNQINESRVYNFKREAKRILKKQVFPLAKSKTALTCAEFKTTWNHVRRAFYLNAENSETRFFLRDVTLRLGYRDLSQFFEVPDEQKSHTYFFPEK